MITRIFKLPDLPDNYYSGKIMSYYRAYDASYDFCRFYGNHSKEPDGIILVYNTNMVIDGEFSDHSELEGFISMISPETIECGRNITDMIAPQGYERHNVWQYKMNCSGNKIIPDTDISLSRMCDIICSCFDGIVPDLWYTDMSHRIRHGVSKTYMYNNSCTAVDFETDSAVFVSNTATLPESRGKGDAAALLRAVAYDAEAKGKTPYLRCYDTAADYYDKIGFENTGKDILFARQN